LLLERVQRWREEGLTLFTSSKELKQVEGVKQLTEEGVVTEPNVTAPTNKRSLYEILKVALAGGIESEPLAEPGIDRAAREYARTHTMGEQAGGDISTEGKEESQVTALPRTVAATDERPLEQFLGYIKEVAQSEHSTYQREVELVRNEEQWTFRLTIMAAILALAIVGVGTSLLLFFTAKLIIGSITAALVALTGRGTMLIRSYAKSLESKRELIQDQQRDSHQTLIAIQTALAIPDHKARSRAMTQIASSLIKRVTSTMSQSRQTPPLMQTGE
jgi:hypothetical protein